MGLQSKFSAAKNSLTGVVATISSAALKVKPCKPSQMAFACLQGTRLREATREPLSLRQSPGTG